MKIVVTGGAGFIGANLCSELAGRGAAEVVAFDNLSTGYRTNLDGLTDVRLIEVDIPDADALAATCHTPPPHGPPPAPPSRHPPPRCTDQQPDHR